MKNTILICICAILLSGCKVKCPDLDKNILSWYPYEVGDIINLSSESNILSLTISNVQIDHTTHYSTGTKCGNCDDNIFIYAKHQDTITFEINVYLTENKISSEGYSIKNSFFGGNPDITANYTINNKVYNQVKIYESTRGQEFKKLIVAKDFGIVSLTDTLGNEWILSENAKREAKPTIRNTSCD